MIAPDEKDQAAARELRYQAGEVLQQIRYIERQRRQLLDRSDEPWISAAIEADKTRIATLTSVRRSLLNRAARLERGTASTHAGGFRD